MIIAEGISKYFGDTAAVENISFGVKEGENLILLGTSGCGKTTTLKMLNRLIVPSKGNITIDGKNTADVFAETLRRNIGYVLQHNALFPHYTVAENIAVVPRLLKWDASRIKKRTEVLLGKLHLPESYLNKYPNELSGGQQQRVNIARAIAAEPSILLMDEPFGALDPITRAGIVKEFMELDEFKKKTIVMVTHDVDEAFEMGDTICLMDKGQVIQIGTPTELLFHPQHPYVRSFLERHYLQLALKTVTLNDIWSSVKDTIINNESLPIISSDESVWYTIKMLSDTDAPPTILIQKDNEVKEVNAAILFTAFNNYKHN